ncbi:S-adenosyl-L-methionine-dependent methyltransferase [Entophlyctis helioformis]|nr:S-adenosyl-L-methionine-dependent methyltransferase [Entophlyctis helioformis]
MAMQPMPPLPKIADLLAAYGVRTKRQLSQNFILQPSVTEPRAGGRILHVEVGPGPGGLTRGLLNAGARHVVAVELDRTVLPLLESSQQRPVGVIHGDIMQADQQAFPLLAMWIGQAARREHLFSAPGTGMTLMFQQEVCERLTAPVGSKRRGRLSVLSQAFFNVSQVATIRKDLFWPVPKVDAGVLQFVPHDRSPLGSVPFATLAALVKSVFSHPNAMIRASLRKQGLAPMTDLLADCGIEPTDRPFMLGHDAFIRLAQACIDHGIAVSKSDVGNASPDATKPSE